MGDEVCATCTVEPHQQAISTTTSHSNTCKCAALKECHTFLKNYHSSASIVHIKTDLPQFCPTQKKYNLFCAF